MEELLNNTGYQLRGFKKGDTVTGKVISIKPSEILIDIGYKSLGIISEREIDLVAGLFPNLKVGDEILVQIVSPETDAGQIVLSIRRAGLDKKWQELLEKKEKGEAVEVSNLESARGGLLVDWQGVRGFLPASQLASALGQKSLGEKIRVIVLDIDKTTNRLVFSEKRAQGEKRNPEALAKIKIAQTYKGTVSGIVPFGVFVNVEGVEGLVHISEMAWEKVGNPSDYYKIGDKIKVLVISTNTLTGRLNLSVKQLTADPWQELVKKYNPEQQITGKVKKISSFGVFVELEKGIEGLIHISKIPPEVELKENEKITCVIEGIDYQKRKISLTLVLKEKPVGYR
ncbi:MAG: S1 RNA-binding domain-containing protein [Patescibacteria group bacterium]|nr:S1 RNA-binding domain-containing protein [Patescibacteria group bacterium]